MALKFYAATVKAQEAEKFMFTSRSVCPSDDELEVELHVPSGQVLIEEDDMGNRELLA